MAYYTEYLDKIRDINLPYTNSFPLGMGSNKYNIRLLLNKLSEAKESYLLLMENNKYADAMLIAGHMLENCAVIDCLVKDEQETKIYIAKGWIKVLYDLLEFVGDENQDANTNATIQSLINELEKRGSLIFKGKNTTHNDIINFLSSNEACSKKLEKIRTNYKMYKVEEFFKPYRHHLSGFYKANIDSEIVMFYSAYCRIKHCGVAFYTPEIDGDKAVIKSNQYREYSPIIVWLCLEYIRAITTIFL